VIGRPVFGELPQSISFFPFLERCGISSAMSTQSGSPHFTIWGVDHAPYGPVELPMLVNWIQDERVTRDTWVFVGRDQRWKKAEEISELQMLFRPKATRADPGVAADPRASLIKPGALRRVKVLANMTDQQLERFAAFMEIERAPQWSAIVKQGDHGDAMYLILEGELRVRMMVSGKETILATMSVGEFFGDISLFDHGPRSADVVANTDATLLKISAAGFGRVTKEAPELATAFLMAICKTLTARIRADNKRYTDSVRFARAAA
jgi:CRP-like cAMP-binding protein